MTGLDKWRNGALWLIAGAFLFRLMVILTAPIDLSGDEAYYWEWGRNLDWGYFSKPPLIGWLMGLSGWLFGNTEWGVRLMALLLGTGSLFAFHQLTRVLFNEKAAFWGVVAILLTPANAAANLIFTIDAPLVFCWTVALLGGWKFITEPDKRFCWGVVLGLALAFGYLSKQMMLVFPLLFLVFLGVDRESRPLLRKIPTWAVLLLPLLSLLPPLLWNAREDWITFQHTGGHFAAKAFSVGKSLSWLGEFIGSQMGLLSPVTWVVLVIVLVSAGIGWKGMGRRERFLYVFCAPALAVFLGLSLRQRILPNWPAVYYVSALTLTVGWLFSPAHGANRSRLQAWFKGGLWIGGLLVGIVYALLYLTPLLPLKEDPLSRIRGWEAYGRAISEAQESAYPGSDGTEATLFVVGHRYYASELAFYHPRQPRVYLHNPPGHIRSQYGLWPGIGQSGKDTALIVDVTDSAELPQEVRSLWESIQFFKTLEIPAASGGSRRVRLYRADEMVPFDEGKN